MARQPDLLSEIEAGAHDPRSDLAAVLRKCIALGGATGSEALRHWASRELKGYGADHPVPDYRNAEAPLLLDGMTAGPTSVTKVTGQMMTPNMLPDFARDEIDTKVLFPQPIAEIEEMLRRARKDEGHAICLSPPGMSLLLPLINQKLGHHQHVERFYWSVSEISLAGILDMVRTNLVELVAEMRAGTPAGQALPTPEVANQVVNFVINGKGIRVVTNQVSGSAGAATAGGTATAGAQAESKARRLGWWVTVLAGVVAAGAGVWALFLR